MNFIFSLATAIFFTLFSVLFLKIYQLENYNIKKFLGDVFAFNLGYGGKNKLKFTNRIKRWIFLHFLLNFLLFFCVFSFVNNYFVFLAVGLLFLFLPILMCVTHVISFLVEHVIMQAYIHKAKKKLSRMTCKKIAITGSFGKTTTKKILFEILAQKYKVCATPKSYNTPMGVCRTILENLKEDDDFFIVEMGARHVHDIEFLCKFVGADYGVLTPVGNCHIETFKSLENVERAKAEICENVADFMLINGKSESNLRIFERCEKKKYLLCCENSFAYAQNVKIKDNQTFFTLVIDGQSVPCSTALLGKKNVDNVVVASALSYLLGVNLVDIVKSVKNLKQVPHRMELIKGYAIVIDDAYNSNFDGFLQALSVIKEMNGRKILVTPGMVELGKKQFEMNMKIAKEIAKVCDIVLIMNKVNKEAIASGLFEAKFAGKIFYAETRNEQKTILKNIVCEGDVVLFENDLPDNYR